MEMERACASAKGKAAAASLTHTSGHSALAHYRPTMLAKRDPYERVIHLLPMIFIQTIPVGMQLIYVIYYANTINMFLKNNTE